MREIEREPRLRRREPKLPVMRTPWPLPRDVAHDRAHLHRRGAARAREPRDHAHGLPVHDVEPLEVDLALEAGVVPPAAGGDAAGGEARGREVGRAALGVDADHEPVGAAALEAVEAELERDVGAAVGAHAPAVEPHPRAVVDRLEAHRPLERPARVGQREVLAVPADAADHRGGRVVAEVPDVRHRDACSSRRGCRLRFQPLPRPWLLGSRRNSHWPVHQVAAGGALVVEGLGRRLVGGRRGAGQRQRDER